MFQLILLKFNIICRCSRFLPFRNVGFIVLTLILCYYFPVIGKSNFNIINLLGYFLIALIVGLIRHRGSYGELFKLLFFSLNKAIFSILNLNYIKTRLFFFIIILPLMLTIFGDYTYLLLNFGLIFNNVKLLQIFMVNRDDIFLSKI